MKSTVRYVDRWTFDAESRGHHFMMDSASMPGSADRGPSPKETLLSAILGCSGIDIVGFLKKEKIEFRDFSMEANAESRAEHPRVFPRIELIFQFSGEALLNESPAVEKINEAVELSMTRYCGVSAMVAGVSPLFYTVIVNSEIEGRGQASFSTIQVQGSKV